MTPVTIDTTVLDTPKMSDTADRTRTNVFGYLRSIPNVCRQVFGIPDYERYLAHAEARHPGQPVLSRRAYFAKAIDRKYGKSGPRCC